ncbi:hypothetical protein A9K65_013615 [Mesorhizobium sp. WSM1497]|uniref:protein NO VEIN domain-containing protein n=1 Tax=Mesorhizobium sp. WSM1497 TaxID=278153 RepID=UPI0007ECA0C4|nr:DUF3883 domain-containing protein [Mesorhizobium sp. WSM1497]ARP64302.1 hypothetical protein A9K65_013615 [Mesorhizobium sp. WSM1497]
MGYDMPRSGKTIIFNTRWMSEYAGPEDNLPRPHFRWLRENDGDIGGERENFLVENDRCRGYVQVHSDHIDLAVLDPGAEDKDVIDGVTVIFTATPATKRTRMIGWYEDASLHRYRRKGLKRSRPTFSAEAPADLCYLIPPAERTFDMYKGAKSHQGQSPVCYISRLNPSFDAEICRYLDRLKRSGLRPVGIVRERAPEERRKRGRLRNVDPILRREIEDAAIDAVWNYYECRGCVVRSVETENKGWDLETDDGLKIEVKGRRANELLVEMTPNEYLAMLKAEAEISWASKYRIGVVTSALEEGGRLHIFAFKGGEWRCQITQRPLAVTPLMGARLTSGTK